jgi:hypothetical protein
VSLYNCAGCGRPTTGDPLAPRSPCPGCGATAWTTGVALTESVAVSARLDVQTIDVHGEVVADGATQEVRGGQVAVGLDFRDGRYERFTKAETGWKPLDNDAVHHFVGAALARANPGVTYDALDERKVRWPDLYLVAPARQTNVEVRQLDDDAVRQLNTERLPLTSEFDALASAVERALTAKTKNKYSVVEMSRAWLALYFPFPSTPIIRAEIQRSVKQLATSSQDFFWQVWLVDAAGHAERMVERS